jgi:hypothetical protein
LLRSHAIARQPSARSENPRTILNLHWAHIAQQTRQSLPDDCDRPGHVSSADSKATWNEHFALLRFGDANGLRWRATCNKKGVRTSSSVTSLFSIPTLPAPTGKSDSGFQVILALASGTGISRDSSSGSGARTLAGENTSSFLAALHGESQSSPIQSTSVHGEVDARAAAPAVPGAHENAAKENGANAAAVTAPGMGVAGSGTKSRAVATAVSRASVMPQAAQPATVQDAPAQSRAGIHPAAPAASDSQTTAVKSNAGNVVSEPAPLRFLMNSSTTTLAALSAISRVPNMPELAQRGAVQGIPSQSQAVALPTATAVPAYQETAARNNGANATVAAAPASFLMDSTTATRAAMSTVSGFINMPEPVQRATAEGIPSQSQASALPTATAVPAYQETAAKNNAANTSVEAASVSFQLDSTTTTRAAVSAVSRIPNMPERAQPASSQNIPSRSQVSALPNANQAPGNQKSSSTEDSSLEQTDVNLPNDSASESSATSANAIDIRSSAIAPEVSAQLPSPPLTTNASATIQTAKSSQLLDPAPPFAAIADELVAGQIPLAALPIGGPTSPSADVQVPAPVDISMAAALPSTTSNSSTAGQPVGKVASKEASDAAGAKNTGPANIANQATSKTAETAGGPHDASSHGAQNNDQPSQNMQANPSQPAAALQRVADGGAPQAQPHPVAMPLAAQENGAAHSSPGSLADASRAIDQRDLPASIPSDSGEVVATAGINSARVIQAMNETEMRVGMHSSEFGDISIRTSVSQQQVLSQISLDHNELSQAISDHVSAMQSKLGSEYGLHASIEINNHGSSFSHGSEQFSQRDQKTFASSVGPEVLPEPAEPDTGMSLGTLVAAGNGHRLDIRA